MIITIFSGNTEELRPLAESWRREYNPEKFGLKGDIEVFLADVQNLIGGEKSDVLVLRDKEKIVGFMGLTCFKSPIGNELIVNEHFWFVDNNYRGIASVRMLKAAEEWGRKRGCSHLMVNASNLASDIYSRICSLYERLGFDKFESSYLKEIK